MFRALINEFNQNKNNWVYRIQLGAGVAALVGTFTALGLQSVANKKYAEENAKLPTVPLSTPLTTTYAMYCQGKGVHAVVRVKDPQGNPAKINCAELKRD